MAILFHTLRSVMISVALFPPAFSLVIVGFDELYGPPRDDEPALPFADCPMRSLGMCGPPRGYVRDDACRLCRPKEMTFFELRAQTGPDAQGGHIFIKTPNMVVGFRAKCSEVERLDYLNPMAAPVEGIVLDDSTRPYSRVLRFRATPKSVALLEAAIKAHEKDLYQLGNWQYGKNCATWAADRLRDAGFTPPPGDCPNRMAWYMQPSPATAGR